MKNSGGINGASSIVQSIAETEKMEKIVGGFCIKFVPKKRIAEQMG